MTRKAASKTGVTATALGRHLGLSKQRIGQLAAEGAITALPDGSFDQDASRLSYIQWLRDDQRRSSRSAVADRMTDARARQLELRTAREAGELMPVEDALAAFDQIIGAVIVGLDAVPAQVTDDPTLRRRIEDAINAVRADVAEQCSKASRDLGKSEETAPDA